MTEEIMDYISQQIVSDETLVIGVEDDLLSEGILDSMGMMRLIRFIEKKYGFDVPFEEMLPENFMSVEKIVDYINSKSVNK